MKPVYKGHFLVCTVQTIRSIGGSVHKHTQTLVTHLQGSCLDVVPVQSEQALVVKQEDVRLTLKHAYKITGQKTLTQLQDGKCPDTF